MNQVANIVKIGDPLLKTRAADIDNFGTRELDELIEFLFYNLDHFHGAGIAAPQLGVGQQIFAYGFEKNPRYPNEKPVPKTVLINPVIISSSDETIGYYEGCLSVPHLRGEVIRPRSIEYQAYTPQGKLIQKTATGFEARIIQHEVDHLNGILFPFRMQSLDTLKYSEN